MYNLSRIITISIRGGWKSAWKSIFDFFRKSEKTLPFYFKEKEEKKDKEQNICVQKVFFIENIFMGALHDPLCLGQDTGIFA